jgi:hypothetical protein
LLGGGGAAVRHGLNPNESFRPCQQFFSSAGETGIFCRVRPPGRLDVRTPWRTTNQDQMTAITSDDCHEGTKNTKKERIRNSRPVASLVGVRTIHRAFLSHRLFFVSFVPSW